MTYEDFLLKVLDIDLPGPDGYYHRVYIGELPADERPYWNSPEKDKDEYLVHSCETGGMSGGSCWDDSNPQPYSTGETLGRFTAISKIVRVLAPNISFLEYEEILDLVETGTYGIGEYYGNGTDYAYQCIKLRDLWSALSEAQCLA